MSELEPTINGAAKIVETAQAAAIPSLLEPGGLASILLPMGSRVQVLDLEKYLQEPKRKRGVYRPATVESLIQYLDLHHGEGTAIWVDILGEVIVGVVNDHAPIEPGWGDHRAILQLIHTPEWNRWKKLDGQLVGQEQFAEHIEESITELVDPDAATMLEIAQSIQATTTASFRSATRLANGEIQMKYDEEVDAKAGRAGQLEIPSRFTLAIAPFYGEEPYQVTARLRYRVSGGKLAIGYRLDKPHEVLLDSLHHIAARLREKFAHVYMGQPTPGEHAGDTLD